MSIRIALVRHGRAMAGWDQSLDPDLDELGFFQAQQAATQIHQLFGGTRIQVITSPFQRCQQTAAAYCKLSNTRPQICDQVAELPSPLGVPISDRVDWLKKAMTGAWSDLDQKYQEFRNRVVEFVTGCDQNTVIFSHFTAINAVIGSIIGDDRLVIRKLDNCSITILIRQTMGGLSIAQFGREADTLIR